MNGEKTFRSKLILILISIILMTPVSVSNVQLNHIEKSKIVLDGAELHDGKNIDLHTSASCQEWLRIWGQIDEDEILGGMDVYNKTGDVYLIGWEQTFVDDDIKLVKYNKSGVLEWSITLDYDEVFPSGQDSGEDVVVDQTTGDIYILASVFNKTSEDLFVAKYSSDGQQIWNLTWGYDDTYEWGAGISFDGSGFIYVVCTISDIATDNENITLVKIDNLGTPEWNATWDKGLDDVAYDVSCGIFGDIYITGSFENSTDDFDGVLIKFDENNPSEKWNATWGGKTYNETGHAVGVDSQGDIYVTGVSEDDSTYDSWMILRKYNNSGALNWSKAYTGFYYSVEGYDLYIDAEDNVFIAVAGFASLNGPELIIQGYNSTGDRISEIVWKGVSNMLSTQAISGYNSNIYIAGNIATGSLWENDFIVVKNPSNICPSGEIPSAGDDDDDDDDDDDTGVMLVVIVIVIACLGAGIFVLVILIKKGIIMAPKSR